MKLPSEKEFKFSDYVIDTLKKIIVALIKIENYLIKIKEQTKREDLIQFISQLLYDFVQIDGVLRKYSNTENTQFQKLLYIFASNFSDIVIYFDQIEEFLNGYNDTNEQYSEFLKFKDLNTFNTIQTRMNEYIEENRFDSEIIFEFLTKTIMSNSPIVRDSAAKTLISNYPVKSIPLLRKWAEKEVFISVARNIWKHLDKSNYEEHHQILNVLLHKISKYNYNLDPNEVKFLLDWDEEEFEYQFPCFTQYLYNGYMEYLNKKPIIIRNGLYDKQKEYFLEIPTAVHYTFFQQNKGWTGSGVGGLETTIFNGHISGLILDYVIKIPETIGLLSKLKYLSIENSKELSVLPNSIKDLRNLRYLYFCETGLMKLPNFIAELPKLRYIGLQGIKLNSIPEWVKKKARKYHSLRYIKEGVNRDDAYVLGLLEILIGVCIDNVRKKVIEDDISYHKLQKSLHLQTAESKTDIKSKIDNEDYIKSQIEEYFYDFHGTTKFYKINDEGYVTGISIINNCINFIPKEIKNLKYLNRFFIFQSSEFPVTIPKSVELCLKSIDFSIFKPDLRAAQIRDITDELEKNKGENKKKNNKGTDLSTDSKPLTTMTEEVFQNLKGIHTRFKTEKALLVVKNGYQKWIPLQYLVGEYEIGVTVDIKLNKGGVWVAKKPWEEYKED